MPAQSQLPGLRGQKRPQTAAAQGQSPASQRLHAHGEGAVAEHAVEDAIMLDALALVEHGGVEAGSGRLGGILG